MTKVEIVTEITKSTGIDKSSVLSVVEHFMTVDVTNDSIVRMNCTDASSYIILRKSPIQMKCHVE